MKMARVWKIACGLALLFALGGVCGATFTMQRAKVRPRFTDTWTERWFAVTSKRLELRDEQVTALKPMVAALQQQLRDLQKETAARSGEIVRQNGRQMWEVLDPAQRDRYRALEDELKLPRAAGFAAPR